MRRAKGRYRWIRSRFGVPATLGIGLCLGVFACRPAADPTALPQGWEASGARWWRTETDTTGLFRRLETFEDMGVAPVEVVFGVGRITLETQVTRLVQRRMLPLYRNRPEVVDSLFRRYVVPRIERSARSDDHPEDQIEPLVQDAYRIIARHFREPRALSIIGQDIPFPKRPDSLRGIEGRVGLQISVDTLGRSVTIELLDTVHPVLDRMAVRALTDMRWSPAYLHGEPIPAWVRFYLGFAADREDE